MHGRNRKSAIFPLKLSAGEVQNNLQKVADCIQINDPDIVTLQEVDRFSVFSGSFNQFEFLAARLKYPYKYFASSCSISFFSKDIFISGNAIFSKYPLENCDSFKFKFSFPTDRMGFVIADFKLPQGPKLSLISAHLVWLDWIRLNSRKHQLELIERVISMKRNPFVIAGDMNCDLLGKEGSLRTFVDKLSLRIYKSEQESLNTSPSWQPVKHIDWVLTSKEVSFVSYNTIPDRVSDHLAIFTTLSVGNAIIN